MSCKANIKKAKKYFNMGAYGSAVKFYRYALDIDPNNYQAHFGLVLCKAKNCELDGLIDLFNEFRVNFKPASKDLKYLEDNIFNAFLEKGVKLLNNDAYGEMAEVYLEALKFSNDKYIWGGLIFGLTKNRELDKAIHFGKESIELYPNVTALYSELAFAYNKKSEFDNALKTINRALEINSNEPKIWAQLGYTYYKKRELDRAIELLNKALEMDSNIYFAHYTLAKISILKGRAEMAREFCQKAMNINPILEKARNLLKKLE